MRDFPYETAIPGIEHPILALNPADSLTKATARIERLLKNGKPTNLPYAGCGTLHYNAADLARHVQEFTAGDGQSTKVMR